MLAEANLDAIRPLADQLRSVALKPDRQLSDAKASDEERAAMVESLCETRARLLRESGSYPDSATVPALDGKILRYAPKKSRADCSPGYESKGFFDANLCPPWDTWIGYAGGELLTYVPRILGGIAQRGIEVDTAECIRWADRDLLTTLFAI